MKKSTQLYLLTLSFNQEFMEKKVSVVKVLRGLFDLTLRDAKVIADCYICHEHQKLHTSKFRDVYLTVNAEQFAFAMAQFMLDEQPKARLENELGDEYQCNMFMWRDVKILSPDHTYDISKYD